jgi:excinuclease ABC subunit A
LDVAKVADQIIDLGPEGGAAGGQIIAQGTPEEVAKVTASFTGQFLKQVLGIAKSGSSKKLSLQNPSL